MSNTKPERARVLTMELQADSDADLADSLRSMASRIERGEMRNGVSGGYSSGYIYDLRDGSCSDHDAFAEQLKQYLSDQQQKSTAAESDRKDDDIEVAPALWAIHIPGPDEYHAAPNKEAADHMAAMHNKAMQEYVANNKLSWGIETITAHVAQWPYDFESHAQELTEFDAAAWGLKDTTS